MQYESTYTHTHTLAFVQLITLLLSLLRPTKNLRSTVPRSKEFPMSRWNNLGAKCPNSRYFSRNVLCRCDPTSHPTRMGREGPKRRKSELHFLSWTLSISAGKCQLTGREETNFFIRILFIPRIMWDRFRTLV